MNSILRFTKMGLISFIIMFCLLIQAHGLGFPQNEGQIIEAVISPKNKKFLVFNGPNALSKMVGSIKNGDLFKLIQKKEQWFEIELSNGVNGWIKNATSGADYESGISMQWKIEFIEANPFKALAFYQSQASEREKLMTTIDSLKKDVSKLHQELYSKELDSRKSKAIRKLSQIPSDTVLIAEIFDSEEGLAFEGGEMLPGCSWYCGPGIYGISSSSNLTSSKDISYTAENAHDFDYTTAWVEGKDSYGIGEYLEYYFYYPDSSLPGLGINQLIIVNGYRKSDALWKANSRVKQFKMYLNDKPIAFISLKDTHLTQFVDFPCIFFEVGKMTKIRFEIIDIFKGEKYKDTAISELLFDGVGVHCLVEGTQISLPDNVTKAIEDLKINDIILSYNFLTGQIESTTVLELAIEYHNNIYKIQFEAGEIFCTADHPFFIQGIGWCSIKPHQTDRYSQYSETKLLRVGSVLGTISDDGKLGYSKIISIERQEGFYRTFAITKLSQNNCYYANGVLVGVE